MTYYIIDETPKVVQKSCIPAFLPVLLSKLLCSYRDFCPFILASFKFFLHPRDLVSLCLSLPIHL